MILDVLRCVFLHMFCMCGAGAFVLHTTARHHLFSAGVHDPCPSNVLLTKLASSNKTSPTSSKASTVKSDDRLAMNLDFVFRRPELVNPNNILAADFFSDPFFYDCANYKPGDYYSASWRSHKCENRRRSFFGRQTVKELLDSFTSEFQVDLAFDWVGIHRRDIFSTYVNTTEFSLQGHVIPLNGFSEMVLADRQFVDLNSKRELLSAKGKILYVFGSYGSGKTQFSLKQAAAYGVKRAVTFYIKLSEVQKSLISTVMDPHLFIKWMQRELSRIQPTYTPNQKLMMHVSLVLDDAGCPSLGTFWYMHENVSALYDLMCENLAESIRLIVCGTGVAAQGPVSVDVTTIRVGQWTSKDVEQVAGARFGMSRKSVAGIFEDPTLAELATNSRSAWHLLEVSSPALCQLDERLGMAAAINELKDRVPEIADSVVTKYICQSALARLDPVIRRRLAAWVFYVADRARAGMQKPYIPEYEGVFGEFEDDAIDFLEWNLVYVDGKPTLRDNREPSVSVSRAIGIILISMLGVSPTVWAGEFIKRSCACHALQQHAIEAVAQYLKAIAEKRPDAAAELDRSLSQLSLTRSTKRVPEPRASKGTQFPSTTVWMNRRGAPFADVVAPFALYKCRAGAHHNGRTEFDILEELLKCGLLKPDIVQARLANDTKRLNRAAYGTETLAAICASWLATNDCVVPSTLFEGAYPEANQIVHCGDVENLRDLKSFIDQVPTIRFVIMFHSVLIPNRWRIGTWADLKTGSTWEPTAVTENDGSEASLAGCLSDISLQLSERQVTPDGTVNEDVISPTQQSQWKAVQRILKEWARENVEIRFCFYGASLIRLEPEPTGWLGSYQPF
jgi:hypothetical protein